MGKATNTFPSWLQHAAIHTIGGICIGALVTLTLLLLMAAMPGVKAAGVDAGIELASHFKLASTTKLRPTEREAAVGVKGYVFVDLDAGRVLKDAPKARASELACRSLVARQQMAVGSDCGPLRDTNRQLLAAALSQVLAHGARAVVIDVELSRQARGTTALEDEALRAALARAAVPVFFALPTEHQSPERLRLTEAPFFTNRFVTGLPLIMSPGLPARQFPACYTAIDLSSAVPTQPRAMLNLPHSLAVALGALPADTDRHCGDAGTRPLRVIYTLPWSGVDADLQTISGLDPERLKQAVKSNGVFGHCLVGNLWRADAHCGQRDFYAGKIVVLGSSAPDRGDWHYTPQGEMPGSMIVVNGLRTAIENPPEPARSWWVGLLYKLGVMLACALLWGLYWVGTEWFRHRRGGGAAVGLAGRLGHGALVLLTVLLVLLLSYRLSFSPSSGEQGMDLLLPGLAVGLEVFVELAAALVAAVKQRAANLLGWEVK